MAKKQKLETIEEFKRRGGVVTYCSPGERGISDAAKRLTKKTPSTGGFGLTNRKCAPTLKRLGINTETGKTFAEEARLKENDDRHKQDDK